MPVIPPPVPEDANTAELVVDRINTNAMIAARPVALTLIPRHTVRDGAGSRLIEDPPRLLQIGRLIDQQSAASQPSPGNDGPQRKDTFQLLLPWDGEVELYDYWIGDDGIRYEVTGILPYNGYEVRAEVTRFGQEGQPIG